MFARQSHDGAFMTQEEEGVHPTRSRVAALKGATYRAKKRSPWSVDAPGKWTGNLIWRYQRIRKAHPDIPDVPPGEIYVDTDLGVVKVGASRLYFDLGDGDAIITDILVDATQRGSGVGRLLVDVAVGLMADMEVESIRLWGEMQAPEFWRRMGFSPDERGIWRKVIIRL